MLQEDDLGRTILRVLLTVAGDRGFHPSEDINEGMQTSVFDLPRGHNQELAQGINHEIHKQELKHFKNNKT